LLFLPYYYCFIGDDVKWLITENLSPNLLNLFGLESKNKITNLKYNDWVAPNKYGNNNNDKINNFIYFLIQTLLKLILTLQAENKIIIIKIE
jgi:hypothetical protein